MAIPKVIYQTYKSAKLPLLAQWHILRFKKNNPDYQYEFYDDEKVMDFFITEYGVTVSNLYKKIRIGAAKADVFRYAVLMKKGGVYLDIDSSINGRLGNFITPDDMAVISLEGHPNFYVQWALVFAPGHPFLVRTMEKVLENIETNKYPNDVHQMTGPTVYSLAIKECLQEDSSIPYRVQGQDYDGHLTFKYAFSNWLSKKSEHWKKKQLHTSVLHD